MEDSKMVPDSESEMSQTFGMQNGTMQQNNGAWLSAKNPKGARYARPKQ